MTERQVKNLLAAHLSRFYVVSVDSDSHYRMAERIYDFLEETELLDFSRIDPETREDRLGLISSGLPDSMGERGSSGGVTSSRR